MEFDYRPLNSFAAEEWHAVLAARQAVFVVEQHCAFQDADEIDTVAGHLRCVQDGRLAAYLRIVPPGTKYAEPSLGRVISLSSFRGQGFGKSIVAKGLEICVKDFPDQPIRISAQSYLKKFYEEFGFEQMGSDYLEDGIAHIEMLKCVLTKS